MFDVVTIGTATRDIFIQSSEFKVLKDKTHLERIGFLKGEAQCFPSGAKIEVDQPVLTIGGGAANAAVTFARQGFRTATIARVGKDSNGAAALEDLKSEKVKSFFSYDPKHMTGFSVILISQNGERTILNHRGASENLDTQSLPKELKARWVYVVPGRIPLSVIQSHVESLRRRGARIAMNPSKFYLDMGWRKLKPLFDHLDVITLNREEAASLTGYHYSEEHKIFRKFDGWVKGLAVMTDGPGGSLVSDGSTIYHAGIFKDKGVVDRTGSGDAFGSGFIAGLIQSGRSRKEAFKKEDIVRAMTLASANATSVVEHIGAQAGILSKSQFQREKRWTRFRITMRDLS